MSQIILRKVPDDIVWKGKKSICDYLELSVDNTKIYEDDGYKKVYKYKENKLKFFFKKDVKTIYKFYKM